MKRLITLGCSLGPKQLWPTYTRRLLISLNLDFTHVHIGAGARGNKVNLFLLNQEILNNGLEDTFILWQLSGWQRHDSVVHENVLRKPQALREDHYEICKNIYTDEITYAIWGGANHPNYELHTTEQNAHINHSAQLEQMITQICLLAKNCKLLVFRGWRGAMPNWDKITEAFDRHNVNYIYEGYVDWVAQRHDMASRNDWHPNKNECKDYFSHVLGPKIKELL